MTEKREAGREETRRRAEQTNEESKRAAREKPEPGSDLSAEGASRRIRGRDEQIDRAVEEAGG